MRGLFRVWPLHSDLEQLRHSRAMAEPVIAKPMSGVGFHPHGVFCRVIWRTAGSCSVPGFLAPRLGRSGRSFTVPAAGGSLTPAQSLRLLLSPRAAPFFRRAWKDALREQSSVRLGGAETVVQPTVARFSGIQRSSRSADGKTFSPENYCRSIHAPLARFAPLSTARSRSKRSFLERVVD